MPIDNSSRFPKPLAADLLELSEGMAIVIDGDTAPKAITAGQYLFIKNHSTLATGGYHATAAIASGADITSSNVAADTDGIVNGAVSKLNGNLASLTGRVNAYKGNSASDTEAITVTPSSGVSLSEIRAVRIGRIIHVNGYATGTFSANSEITLATTSIKPTYNLRTLCGYGEAAYSANKCGYMIWDASTGAIKVNLPTTGKAVTFVLEYVIN